MSNQIVFFFSGRSSSCGQYHVILERDVNDTSCRSEFLFICSPVVTRGTGLDKTSHILLSAYTKSCRWNSRMREQRAGLSRTRIMTLEQKRPKQQVSFGVRGKPQKGIQIRPNTKGEVVLT